MDIDNSGVSADSLFHFTSELKILENILRNGFYIRYSLEDFSSIADLAILAIGTSVALPMVCFCDIPLSQIKYHTKNYGCYAIGMTKEWAQKEKISPVVYTYKNALTTESLNSILAHINTNSPFSIEPTYKNENEIDSEILKKTFEKHIKGISHFDNFIKFIKPYKGKVWRDEIWKENEITFYNEREWRYVPTNAFFEANNIKGQYEENTFKVLAKRRAMNLTLQKLIKLKFKPKDIKYIIVRESNEIPNMVEKVGEMFKNEASHSDLLLLYTKIFSLDQIISDF